MKRILYGVLLGSLLTGVVSAAERLWFEGQQLELNAQARACYLGFLKLYDVDYFHGPTPDTSCIRLSYLREFGADTLGEATRKVFEQRHGEEAVGRYQAELELIADAYRPVAAGDQYVYCVTAHGEGRLLRDDKVVANLESPDFANRFLQLWVQTGAVERTPQWGFSPC